MLLKDVHQEWRQWKEGKDGFQSYSILYYLIQENLPDIIFCQVCVENEAAEILDMYRHTIKHVKHYLLTFRLFFFVLDSLSPVSSDFSCVMKHSFCREVWHTLLKDDLFLLIRHLNQRHYFQEETSVEFYVDVHLCCKITVFLENQTKILILLLLYRCCILQKVEGLSPSICYLISFLSFIFLGVLLCRFFTFSFLRCRFILLLFCRGL